MAIALERVKVSRPAKHPGRGALFGALDLGTNNCRLLVAKPAGSSLQVVDAFSRLVRLGEGMALTGSLSRAAMDRTIAALRVCASKMRRHWLTDYRVVATAACRQAENGAYFLDRAERETGLTFELITPGQEAMLALAGCAALLDRAIPNAIVFDIGGGSTEVMYLSVPASGPPEVRGWISMPLGVVSLADQFGAAAATEDGYLIMRSEIECQLEPFEAEFAIAESVRGGRVQMLGTSGTVTTLTGIHLDLARYDRRQVDGAEIAVADLAAVTTRVMAMSNGERAAHPCIGRARADLVLAGCAILDAILARWPVERVRIADRGVREGILLGLMGIEAPVYAEPRLVPESLAVEQFGSI
jgi:exopolyphosphatase/guanosine-5'-triphosphate,3'-diphosphate pyrophosphatase